MIGFGNWGKRNLEITSLADKRLLKIDPSQEGFFDKVLGCDSYNEKVEDFIEAIKEVKEAELAPFWRPIFDPSEEDDKIVFSNVKELAYDHTVEWWRSKINDLPSVEGKKWYLCSEYQYYAFLVWLVNQLVEKGWYIESAITGCVYNTDMAVQNEFRFICEYICGRKINGICNLFNPGKILLCSYDEVGGYWDATGSSNGVQYALAEIFHFSTNEEICNHVGLPILV